MVNIIQAHPILKYQRHDFYPYILLPQALELHIKGPTLPDRPVIHEPVIPERPTRPRVPEVPQQVWDKLTAAASTGAGLVVLIGIIIAELPWFIVLAGTAGVAALAKFAYDSFTYEQRLHHYETVERPRYERELREYPEKIAAWEKRCAQIKREHQLEQKEADRKYELKVEEIVRLWSQNESLPFEIQSSDLDVNSNAREGRFDSVLRNRVKTEIPDLPDITISLMPTGRGLSIPGYDYPYTPDTAIRVSGRGKEIFIDIENDEPWHKDSSGNKQPSHTLYDEKQSRRDNFFKDKGWIVIRFSEKQIYNKTDNCVDFILDVIRAVFKPSAKTLSNPPTDHQRWDSFNALTEWRP
jgi:hypothetical protein